MNTFYIEPVEPMDKWATRIVSTLSPAFRRLIWQIFFRMHRVTGPGIQNRGDVTATASARMLPRSPFHRSAPHPTLSASTTAAVPGSRAGLDAGGSRRTLNLNLRPPRWGRPARPPLPLPADNRRVYAAVWGRPAHSPRWAPQITLFTLGSRDRPHSTCVRGR